jgi:hypothetical protein
MGPRIHESIIPKRRDEKTTAAPAAAMKVGRGG